MQVRAKLLRLATENLVDHAGARVIEGTLALGQGGGDRLERDVPVRKTERTPHRNVVDPLGAYRCRQQVGRVFVR